VQCRSPHKPYGAMTEYIVLTATSDNLGDLKLQFGFLPPATRPSPVRCLEVLN
jgi:hypothetical protein